ncbi:MAG: hypothetical protein ACRD3E_20840 [Terriglobales bacterium]
MTFIRSGLRVVRETPALAFAEIAWRWTFGVAVWIALVLIVRTIMAGVDVTPVETTFDRTSDAFLIADAVARVIVQVLPHFVHALVIAVPLLALVWIAAATLGRAATLRALARSAGFQPAAGSPARGARDGVLVPPDSSRLLFTLTSLNALRALFTIAASLAFFGTVFFVSSNTAADVQSGVAPLLVLAWLLLALFVGLLWGVVNWFLALAPIFCVRDGTGVWRAIAGSVDFYRHRSREYMAIASAYGLFRLAAMVVAIMAGFVVVAAGTVRIAVVLSMVIALVYFAIADFFYIARMASYVALGTGPSPVEVVSAAVANSHQHTPYTETET